MDVICWLMIDNGCVMVLIGLWGVSGLMQWLDANMIDTVSYVGFFWFVWKGSFCVRFIRGDEIIYFVASSFP